MFKLFFILVVVFLACLLFSSGNKEAYEVIENNTSGILGAILGGIVAGISIILSVLITATSGVHSKVNLESFRGFLDNLKLDVKVLLICLVASIILPYLRVTGIPVLNYPIHQLLPSRDEFYTSLELTTIVVSLTIILEVFNVMFGLVLHFSNLHGSDNDDSTNNG